MIESGIAYTMQLRNGSLLHYIPGHYELGYPLVAYGREKYGNDFWKKVTQDAAAYRPLFYPMQGAIRKYTGISYQQFVKDAFSFYEQQWNKDKEQTSLQWLTETKKNNVVNYQYPYAAEDDTLIVLKTTGTDIPAFYKIDAKKTETKIAVRDIAYDDYFSYNNGKIIYTSFEPDIRWGNRDYSVIKILDLQTKEEKKITTHSKYFSPDISHDGKTIAAVEYMPGQRSKLVLLDDNGNIIHTTEAGKGYIYSYPKFSGDDKNIFVMERNTRGEMALLKASKEDNAFKTIIPYANRILGFPVVKGDTVFYTCSNNGRDEIFAYIDREQKNYRVATYPTGLYQATAMNDGVLVASAFTSSGYRLAKMTGSWELSNTNGDTLTAMYVTKPFSRKDNEVLDEPIAGTYSTSKYPRLFHPFNFHSWVPSISYPDYSFSIYGENVLNTLQSQLYYTYNSNEQYHRVGYPAVYGGWYLQPFININETFNRTAQLNEDTTVKWNEFLASAGLQLPLNLTSGKQYRSLTLSAAYNINNIQWKSNTKQLLNDITYVTARLSYSGQIQKAPKQIYPRWAQSFLVQYRASVASVTAHQFLATGNLYLPGIAKTHNLVLNAAYQSRDTARQYSYTNNFPYSRGYDVINYPRTWKIGANYHFPLLYPDWGFGNMIYFTRIRANIFYDYTNLKSLRTGAQYQLKSYGTEIYFDTKWWNQQPLTFGIRYSRLIDYKLAGLQPNQWAIILPVTLIN